MATNLHMSGPPRYAHQTQGLRWLIKQRGVAALVFDPGTGKTATTVDYLNVLANKLPGQEVRAIVVCPSVALDTWVTEIRKWLGESVNFWAETVEGSLLERAQTLAERGGKPFRGKLSRQKPSKWRKKAVLTACEGEGLLDHRGEFQGSQIAPEALSGPKVCLAVVGSEGLAQRSKLVGSRNMADIWLEAFKRYRPDIVIVDESHRLKNPNSNISRIMYRVGQNVDRRVILTGTLMPHSPLDVHGQWKFLDRLAFYQVNEKSGEIETMAHGRFKEKFAVTGGDFGKRILGFRNLDELQDTIKKRSLVVKKEDALDLPAVTDMFIEARLSDREFRLYENMKSEMAVELDHNTYAYVTTVLTKALRLRQLTAGYIPDSDGEVRTTGHTKINAVRDLVNDNLAGEKRLVIFCNFTYEIEQLAEKLQKSADKIFVINGETPKDERVRMRKTFGSDDPSRIILIAQISTLSLAVNELVTASHAIFASLTLRRDDYIQARDRLHRLGQTKPVTFWHVICPKTIDQTILKTHLDRTDLETAILDHIRS